jgi:cobalt-precorrin 5A hydrolase
MVSPARPIKILALTPQGAALARRLGRALPGARCCLPRTIAGEADDLAFDRPAEAFREAFERGENLVCIMAAGIVVRGIAPYLKNKAADPAVVVVDEAGGFAVSLLAGHLGGANDLAREVARILGATPVITTASDVQGLPALDVEAVARGLTIENLAEVRAIQMALLKGRRVRVVDPQGFLDGLVWAYPESFA